MRWKRICNTYSLLTSTIDGVDLNKEQGIMNVEQGTRNKESGIWILNKEQGMLNIEQGTRDVEYWTRNKEQGMMNLNVEQGTRNEEWGTSNKECWGWMMQLLIAQGTEAASSRPAGLEIQRMARPFHFFTDVYSVNDNAW
jgi:hypothetical protein